ncbi:MAG: PBP1A family penicillin-binding protein [Candidatus Moranbacteria bacterium]|nr:PBP1A family penicillin-binding protein [Candidatus Moranbacteria bacterium]
MKPIFISKNFRSISAKDRWKLAGKIFLYLCGAGFLFVAGLFIYFAKDLPSPTDVNTRVVPQSTKIYDRTGEHLLYDVHGDEKRTIVPLSQIPDNVKYATIALEDQGFYTHHGVVITSIIRSALKDVIKGGAAQGGSTITQQLVKQSLLTSEKTLTRKIKELILSIEIEQRYSKDEILSMYLNEIPYGSSAYGIEAASQTFFSKSAKDLTLPEAALLASLPNAPTYYSPFGSHTDALVGRKSSALQKMADQGYITQEQADEAKNVNILAEITPKQDNISAPHFVMYVKDYLVSKYGEQAVEQGGLKVYTTLNWDMQQAAEKAVTDGASKNAANKASNAALVAADPKTGQILAMVGSKNYFDKSIDGQVNVANANRQPGSSFKPYVYLEAFSKGYTPETLLFDVPTNFNSDSGQPDYSPQNYDGKFHGPLQMKNALAMSLNIPAVKTLYLAGVKDSIGLAKGLGITGLNQPDRYGLSLVLGGGEVKLIDHVNAYGALAAGGVHRDKTVIMKVEDKDGSILEQYKQTDGQRIIDEKYVGMLDYIMSTNDFRAPTFGENNPFKFTDRPVAAKTGTTNEFRDGWAMGFTPSLVAGVWAGNNDNSSMKTGADGIVVAAPIWRAFMDQALKNYSVEQFPKYEKEDAGKAVLNGDYNTQDIKVCQMDKGKNKGDYCLANDSCPSDAKDTVTFGDVHDILYYVNKDDPRGDYPKDPTSDPQYKNWEKGVQNWLKDNKDNKTFRDLKKLNAPPTQDCKSEYFSANDPKPEPTPEPTPAPAPAPAIVPTPAPAI